MSNRTIQKLYYGSYLCITILSIISRYFTDTDRELPKPVMYVFTAAVLFAFPVYLISLGMKIKQNLDKQKAEECGDCAELTEAEEWL